MASGEVPTVPDPDDRNRHIRAHAVLARMLDDLVDSGFLKNTAGQYSVVITDPIIPNTIARLQPPDGTYDCDFDETRIIPGPAGATGATGATGPAGPAGTGGGGMMPEDLSFEEPPPRHSLWLPWDGNSSNFLNGAGGFSAPAGSGATAVQLRSTMYKPFTLGTDAYEFTGSDLGNFTAVNSGSHTVVATEDNDMLSLAHPGSDASAELHAWMKTCTWNTNDYIEAWVGATSKTNGSLSVGLIASDGHTYNSGNQVLFDYFNTLSTGLATHTKFNTAGTSTGNNLNNQFSNGLGLRLQYLGSNQWAGFVSLDGENWLNVTGTLTKTLSPTEYGFFCSTWGSANAAVFNLWYIRKGS